MANEAYITSTMRINKSYVTDTYTDSFSADVATSRGPAPGLHVATPAGASVDLSKLGDPGLCHMKNISPYRVIVGIKDTSSGNFYPMIELLPGEGYNLRLARDIESELSGGTGTGTAGSGGTLYTKSIGGSADMQINAYER